MSACLLKIEDWEQVAREAGFQPARMAALCRISLRQLERDFEKQFRKTPTEWVRELRCRLALRLAHQNFLNKAIVVELKFSDASHLCHEFKRVYKESPRKFIRRMVMETNVATRQQFLA